MAKAFELSGLIAAIGVAPNGLRADRRVGCGEASIELSLRSWLFRAMPWLGGLWAVRRYDLSGSLFRSAPVAAWLFPGVKGDDRWV